MSKPPGKTLSTDHHFAGEPFKEPRKCTRCDEPAHPLVSFTCPKSTAACYNSHEFPLPHTDDSVCLTCGVAWSISEMVMCKGEPESGQKICNHYPRDDGDVTTLGPEIFISHHDDVICHKGKNYTPQPTTYPMDPDELNPDTIKPPEPYKITVGEGNRITIENEGKVDLGTWAAPGGEHRVQIVVLHNDESYTYHPVPAGQGWKMVNPGLLLIGTGLGRVHVPLIGVRYFMPEAY